MDDSDAFRAALVLAAEKFLKDNDLLQDNVSSPGGHYAILIPLANMSVPLD